MTDPVTLITTRRQEIEAEISKLQERISALRAELPDLQVAERVLARLAGQTEETVAAHAEEVASLTKPPNTPTVPEMIVTALLDAAAKGSPGLEPKAMTDYIAGRWWPNAPGEAISPIAWRMWKRHQLRKEGPLYMLPENTEAAGPSPRFRLRLHEPNQH